MTSYSNRLASLNASGDEEPFADLTDRVNHAGAYALADWAKALRIDKDNFNYIDNCWLKVTVSTEQLATYVETFLAAEHANALKARMRAGQRYVIEAEEF